MIIAADFREFSPPKAALRKIIARERSIRLAIGPDEAPNQILKNILMEGHARTLLKKNTNGPSKTTPYAYAPLGYKSATRPFSTRTRMISKPAIGA